MNQSRTIWLKFRSLGQRRAVKQEIHEELGGESGEHLVDGEMNPKNLVEKILIFLLLSNMSNDIVVFHE
jgi:hypothetical protein